MDLILHCFGAVALSLRFQNLDDVILKKSVLWLKKLTWWQLKCEGHLLYLSLTCEKLLGQVSLLAQGLIIGTL